MTVSVLIHGPGVVDSGYTTIILDHLYAKDDVVYLLNHEKRP